MSVFALEQSSKDNVQEMQSKETPTRGLCKLLTIDGPGGKAETDLLQLPGLPALLCALALASVWLALCKPYSGGTVSELFRSSDVVSPYVAPQ